MTGNKNLIIIGAGGHGKVIADIAFQMNKWEEIYFLDDYSNEQDIMGFKVVGTSKSILEFQKDSDFIVGIGNNDIRQKINRQLELIDVPIATLIHPNATVGLDVQISKGTVVMAGSVINTSTKIGKGVIINTGTSIDHDCVIGDFVHLSPGVHIAGTVSVGNRTWIGIGSSLVNNISISKDIIVGAGSTVLRNLTDEGIYVGSPLKYLNRGCRK